MLDPSRDDEDIIDNMEAMLSAWNGILIEQQSKIYEDWVIKYFRELIWKNRVAALKYRAGY